MRFLLLIFILLFIISCEKDKPTQPVADFDYLTVNLQPFYGLDSLYLDSTYLTNEGHKVKFTDIRCFFTNMKNGLDGCDIVMMLRLQNERMQGSFLPSKREYYEFYGLTSEKLKYASKDALIMHPGPLNRGVEIDTKLADDINVSLIKEQVELGVAVRMACLKRYCK